MYFDHGDGDRFYRVMQRDRCVRIAARVQQHRLGPRKMRLVQPVDQHAFMIGLAAIDADTQLFRLKL